MPEKIAAVRIPDVTNLASRLAGSVGIALKQEIAMVSEALDPMPRFGVARVPLGDDAAAIPDGNGHLLLAAEGMLGSFVEDDPWFAGWSAVMANVSDIAAMGGRSIAVVDVYWHREGVDSTKLFEGIRAASEAFGVPVVGGHTGRLEAGAPALAVAIIGRAGKRLMTSFGGRTGHTVLAAIDLRGEYRRDKPYWNAATGAPPERLRGDLEVLVDMCDRGAVAACKDISMGGLAGTLLMLIEASGCGAELDLQRIPLPAEESDFTRWLSAYPSFGYLLAVDPAQVSAVSSSFHRRQIACAPVATLDDSRALRLRCGEESAVMWDLKERPLTGFSKDGPA
jgi:AIR synthase-related protein